MKHILVAIIFLCSSSIPAMALDYEDEFPGPALYASMPLEIEEISLFVSESKVQYSYVIVNKTEQNLLVPFTFSIPPYKWTGTHRDVYKNAYRCLNADIDGRQVRFEKFFQATIKGKDIAPILLGLNIDPVFESLPEYAKTYRGTIKANPALTDQGYLQEICEDNCDNPDSFYFVPRWTVCRDLFFRP